MADISISQISWLNKLDVSHIELDQNYDFDKVITTKLLQTAQVVKKHYAEEISTELGWLFNL
ncbi:hypothetical protein DGG96_18120 [Legionella qingyii]|uniref:Uncharacterized protein n=1 Tax=Legionella qingyii TaxID=2184757 RepID=A0A317U160_9GAMM|nr:hypothetical protein DGG96_18120 [Legionella qingyii]